MRKTGHGPRLAGGLLKKYPQAKAVIVDKHIRACSRSGQDSRYMQQVWSRADREIQPNPWPKQGKTHGTIGDYGVFHSTEQNNHYVRRRDVVSDNKERMKVLLVTQSRDKARHYEHNKRLGYNYGMSNIVRYRQGQLRVLDQRRKSTYSSGWPELGATRRCPVSCRSMNGTNRAAGSLHNFERQESRPIDIIEALEAEKHRIRPIWETCICSPTTEVVISSAGGGLTAFLTTASAYRLLQRYEDGMEKVCGIIRNLWG